MEKIEESFEEFKKSLTEGQTDPELMDKVNKEVTQNVEECPRCGKNTSECECIEKDSSSTVNLYRIPKGKQVEN